MRFTVVLSPQKFESSRGKGNLLIPLLKALGPPPHVGGYARFAQPLLFHGADSVEALVRRAAHVHSYGEAAAGSGQVLAAGQRSPARGVQIVFVFEAIRFTGRGLPVKREVIVRSA